MGNKSTETAPATPPSTTDGARIELKTGTTADLQKLKDKLKSDHGITNENDPNVKAEMEELTKIFDAKKNEIKFITHEELTQLAKAIKDTAPGGQPEKLEGTLDVNADGELVFNEAKTESATATPEAPKPAEPASPEITAAVAFFKEEGEFIDQNTEPPETLGTRMAKWLKNMISGFVVSLKEMFGQDVSNEKAQIEGYKDALSKKKVDGMMSGLIPYMGGVLEKTSITKKEGLANFIESTGVPLVYRSENGQQQIMIAPQVMKYVFEGTGGEKLQNILKNNPEAFQNIQAVRRKYLSLGKGASIADISATDRVKEIFTVEEEKRGDYIQLANDQSNISESSNIAPDTGLAVGAVPLEDDSASPEAQNQDRKEAKEAEAELEKAKNMTPVSVSEKALQAEAIKKATENINAIKDREKGIMLLALKETDDTLADSTIKKETLEAGDTEKNKSEIAKLVKEIDLYTKSQKDIRGKIDSIMTTTDASRDKWTFQDTKNTDAIILARIGIQSILGGTLDVSSKRETGEVDKTKTEVIAEEVEKLSQEMEKSSKDYKDATSERKTVLKKGAIATLATIKEKNTQAITENTKIQQDASKSKEDTALLEQAQKSDKAAKKITEILENAQKAMNQMETEGASELEPLDPTDRNNLVYYDGKLYQTNLSSNTKGGYRYHEMFFDGDYLRQGTYGKTIEYKTNRELQEGGYKTISYGEANNIIRDLGPGKINKNSDDWIYVAPEYFSGKLRNIKIN